MVHEVHRFLPAYMLEEDDGMFAALLEIKDHLGADPLLRPIDDFPLHPPAGLKVEHLHVESAGVAEPELDPEAVKSRMYEYLNHIPQAARSLGIRVENGNANPQDVERIAKDRLFVQIEMR